VKARVFLFALAAATLALGACTTPMATITTTVTVPSTTGAETSTPITTPSSTPTFTVTPTYTLPATPSTPVQPKVIPDSGYIRISGEGLYKFQRVYGDINQPTYFEGVIFAPHQEAPGITSTGPIAYKIDIQFADGTVEVLQYIGLGNANNLDISLTKHEHPRAGILLSW
jgi:hypothetical protein